MATILLIDKLPKHLDEEQLEYSDVRDRIFTHLILMDYDWMHYRIQAEIPYTIDDNKLMLVEFKYFGATNCDMIVQVGDERVRYGFKSQIFDKYLAKYLDRMAESVKNSEVFYGGDIVVDFYNEVKTFHHNIALYPDTYVDPIKIPEQ